jgi:hypothetical protein
VTEIACLAIKWHFPSLELHAVGDKVCYLRDQS